MATVTCPREPLTRDLDVVVNINRPITEIATDMTMICFATPNVSFSTTGGSDRVRFYSSMSALTADVGTNTPAYWAGNAFFSRSTHPETLCIGQIFEEPSAAALTGGVIDTTKLSSISNGAFDIQINGTTYQVLGLDFTTLSTLDAVATAISTALGTAGTAVVYNGTALKLTTTSKGVGSTMSYATATTATIPGTKTQNDITYIALTNSEAVDVLAVAQAISDGVLSVKLSSGATLTTDPIDFTAVTAVADVETALQQALTAQGFVGVVKVGTNFVTLSTTLDTSSTSALASVTAASTGTDLGAVFKLLGSDNPKAFVSKADDDKHYASLTGGSITETFATIASIGKTTYTLGAETYDLDLTNVQDINGLVDAFNASAAFAVDYVAAVSANDTSAITITALNDAAYVTPVADTAISKLNLAADTMRSCQPTYYAEAGYTTTPATNYTDVSELLCLTQATSVTLTSGSNLVDIAEQLSEIATAAKCAQKAIYGWVLDAKYRDQDAQRVAAAWAEARDPAYLSLCTNSATAYDLSDATNIGYYCYNQGYKRTSVIYHDNAQLYPDMSYIACALSVNYAQDNSTLTMKFKQLDGIDPSPLTETQLVALESRRINSYIAIGNTSTEVREGVQGNSDWFTDSLVNLDNFKEELQVEVFNVFLRNKKVPYTTAGQNLLISAAAKICRRYTRNGTFADRDEETTDNETGYQTLPATTVTPATIYSATASERASRVAPPITITAYEAGAFHKVTLNVDVYS